MSSKRKGGRLPKSARLKAMIPPNPQEYLAKIPRELLLLVDELQPILRLNGSIQVRRERDRKPTYRLRFRDRDATDGRVQKSITVPEEAVPGVRLMLIGFQGTYALETERERKRKRMEEHWRRQGEGEELGTVPGF